MHNVDTRRAFILIGICALLASAITGGWNQFRRQPLPPNRMVSELPASIAVNNSTGMAGNRSAQVEAEARRGEAEEKAAQHAAYLARYLNSGVPRQPGMKSIAVAMAAETGQFNSVLTTAISDRFKTDSAKMLNSLFRPAFVTDGLLANVLDGSPAAITKLDLAKSLDVLLLGRQTVQYSSDPSLENVITANMRFELTAMSIANGQNQSWAYNSNGAGFKQSEARAMAEERLLKQIAKDSTLSLRF